MIKKILVVMGIAVMIVVIGAAFFMLTFDANQFRPYIVKRFESGTGSAIRIGDLSLAWRGGIALEMKRLEIYRDLKAQGHPVIELESASALVRLVPLLRKELEVVSMVFSRPHLRIARTKEGLIEFLTVKTGETQPAVSDRESTSPSPAFAAGSFFIAESVEIRGGGVQFVDESKQPPLEINAREIDVKLRDVSLTRPISIKGKLALFGRDQNVSFEGRLLLPMADSPGRLRNGQLEADLKTVEPEELFRFFPEMKTTGLQEEMTGSLVVRADELVFDARGVRDLKADIRLENGKAEFASLEGPVKDITIHGAGSLKRVEFEKISGRLAEGSFFAQMVLGGLSPEAPVTFQASLNKLFLDALMPKARPSDPKLRGKLSASFRGQSQGLVLERLTQTLSGDGNIQIEEGVVENLNVSREILGRLSMIPGLAQRLKTRLPESYRKKLEEKDTVLRPIDLGITVSQGILSFANLLIASEMFELSGTGQLYLNGELVCQGIFFMDPEMSAAIIRSVNELQYLTDREGRLAIPVVVSGRLDSLKVRPDLQYVASKLAVTKAREWIGDMMQKEKPEKDSAKQGEMSPREPSYRDLFSGLLQRTLQTAGAGSEEASPSE